jgi:asparagine synthase (glutamine-hydrolysing)
MCGICGIVDFRGRPIQEDIIRNMCQSMTHRGPDDEGVYINHQSPVTSHQLKPSVGMGHRRLSIIDLSPAGHQPMCNEDETVWIVLNGEIYNYLELSKDLKEKGHKFNSNTDTEVIIHLYEEYGEECVRQLRGMFAFAIWDERKQTLLLARDRPGKKPLLYYHKNNLFCFSSEFSSLLAPDVIYKEIEPKAIHYYLTFGYIPAPMTIYKDVYKLPPAHILILKDGQINIKQYWSLNYTKKIKISEDDAADEVLRLLKEAVRIRLYSDVPLGAFLSGGIDSSTVVGLMSQLTGEKVKTFSVGFDNKDYNELKYAKTVADTFNTEHHEFIVKPKALEILPILVERYGEPYADSSAIPTYYVSQQTRQHVTVALNGDGGDELFAGYERYQAVLLSEYYHKIPVVIRDSVIQKLTKFLPDSTDPKNHLRRIKRFIDGAALPLNQRYMRWVGILDENLKREIYTDEFSKEVLNLDSVGIILKYLNNPNGLTLLDKLLLTDTMTYLPNDLLVKVDITSMTNSLECRSPFLDHHLMEFTASLPAEFKIKRFIKKNILKKAVKNIIPHNNIHRRKMGFGVPVGVWFRGELKGFLQETLLSQDSLNRGYFKPDKIKDMVHKHASGQRDWGAQLWTLLMLELWHKRFIDE